MKKFFLFILIVAVLVGGAFFVRMPLTDLYLENVFPLAHEEIVYRYSEKYAVPPSVIYAVMKCESGFREEVVSHAGAVGLMQLMPDTFTWLSKKSTAAYEQEQIGEPEANIHIGVYYLSWLYGRFGSWDLVFAAYNAGHNRVKNWMENGTLYDADGTLSIPIRETANYVQRVCMTRDKYLQHYEKLREMENGYE